MCDDYNFPYSLVININIYSNTNYFFIFLKFGLYLTDGVSSYFSEKILLDEFSLFGNVLIGLILLFTFNSFWKTSASLEGKTTEAIILILMSEIGRAHV